MNHILGELDGLRAACLRLLLSSKFLRSIFCDRAVRLSLSFVLLSTANFFFASAFPVWILALGPVVLGVPHLFASLRFVSKLAFSPVGAPAVRRNPDAWIRNFGAILIFVIACVRLSSVSLTDLGVTLKLPAFNSWELVAGILFFAALTARFRKIALASIASLLLVSSVVTASLLAPLMTLALLAFGHNFVAFAFWGASTKNKREQIAVGICLIVAIIGHAMMFSPLSGEIYSAFSQRFSDPKGVALDPYVMFSQILPGFRDLEMMRPLLAAFAFGQSMHYFVWLKAIPEQHTQATIPLGFRQSWSAIKKDLGWLLAPVAVLASVVVVGSLFFLKLEILYVAYFAFASSHGYLELAALPFALGKNSK